MVEIDAERPLHNRTLLLADDELRLRQLVSMMLEDLGARVIAVENGEKAVQIYLERQTEIDAVLLDLRMKGMSGEEAFHAIKQISPHARIVLSSGVIPDADFLNGIRSAGCDFIEKPFDMDSLSDVISAVLR